jgi:hypothetical protein
MRLTLALCAVLFLSPAMQQKTTVPRAECSWRVRVLSSEKSGRVLATTAGSVDSLRVLGQRGSRTVTLRIPQKAKAMIEAQASPMRGHWLEVSVNDSVISRGKIGNGQLPVVLPLGSDSSFRTTNRLSRCPLAD